MKVPKLDDLDRRLLLALQADPRAPYELLGSALDVTGQTVSNRLRRMQSAGLIRLRAQANLEALGLDATVLGLVACDLASRPRVEETLASEPGVLVVRRVMGEFDLAFEAAFAKATAVNQLVEALHELPGLHRVVVCHGLETILEQDGWQAAWSAHGDDAESVEWLQELSVPKHQALRISIAVDWVNAFVRHDREALERLSTADITFRIMPPNRGVGVFPGLAAVIEQSSVSQERFRRIWYTPVAIHQASSSGFDFVIDAMSPVELADGSHSSAFSRLAFRFTDTRISEVVLLGVLNLGTIEESLPPSLRE